MKTNNQNLHKELTVNNVSKRVSDKYAPVSTLLFIKPFLDKGWINKKGKTFENKKGVIHREIIELIHPNYKSVHGDITLKVVNSYDASSALRIYVGIHRQVCSNGLVMMVEGEQFRFIHRGTSIYERLENSYDEIVAYLDTVKVRTTLLENKVFNLEEKRQLVENIAKRVWEKDAKTEKVELIGLTPFRTRQITQRRRQDDLKDDAFTFFNVIQENITRHGKLQASVKVTNKETNVTSIKTVSKRKTENQIHDLRMNQIIFEETLKLAA